MAAEREGHQASSVRHQLLDVDGRQRACVGHLAPRFPIARGEGVVELLLDRPHHKHPVVVYLISGPGFHTVGYDPFLQNELA